MGRLATGHREIGNLVRHLLPRAGLPTPKPRGPARGGTRSAGSGANAAVSMAPTEACDRNNSAISRHSPDLALASSIVRFFRRRWQQAPPPIGAAGSRSDGCPAAYAAATDFPPTRVSRREREPAPARTPGASSAGPRDAMAPRVRLLWREHRHDAGDPHLSQTLHPVKILAQTERGDLDRSREVEPVRHGRFTMGHPFLNLPNVIGSPHNSAGGGAWRDEYLRRAVRNCRRAAPRRGPAEPDRPRRADALVPILAGGRGANSPFAP
jgi:hypothetical protein